MKLLNIPLVILAVTMTATEAQEITPTTVESFSFDADFFNNGREGSYGVIVLTGSGGGKANYSAERIAEMGFDVLSLAYFDRNGTSIVPETLELIPLEYFEEPKQWLMDRPNTRNDGVILYGLSKGAELSLVLASHDSDYEAVIALAPSHVVWQGNPKNFANLLSSPSSWSQGGQGLPFVPYVSNEERDQLGFSNRHAASLTNNSAVEEARIKVEDISGPVLLLSGSSDNNWPSSSMGAEICKTINSSKPESCSHIIYEGGDHLLSNFQSESFAAVESFLNLVSP